MMVRAVLILASLMVVAGAFAIVNGSGMILNERGWSQLIAGAVVMTGGFIVMALAALLHEFKQWTHHAQQNGVSSLTAHGSENPLPAPVFAETHAFEHPQTFDHAKTSADQNPASLHGPQNALTADPHHGASAVGLSPVSGSRDTVAVAEEAAHPMPAPPVPEMIVTPPADDYAQISPVPPSQQAQHSVSFAPEPAAPLADGGALRPQLKQPTLFELVQEQQTQQQSQQQLLKQAQPPALHEPFAPRAQTHQAMPPLSAMPDSLAVATPPAERILLASYSTGGVGYFMYSDQSIEAEMAIGRYRFNSMDELRRFIETQEGGVKVSG